MSFFVDRFNRRKSPIALAAFGAAVLFMVIFAVCYMLLAKPLYYAVAFSSQNATVAAHSLLISIAGTAICCLLFLLKDKRVVPYGFAGLAVALCMFYIAAMLLEGYARSNILYLITAYGLAPVLVGNAVSWPVYLRWKHAHPDAMRRKTIAEELKDAIAADAAKHLEKAQQPIETSPKTAAPSADALFGPQADRSPMVSRSAQDEAMLFYEDDDDAEAGNH